MRINYVIVESPLGLLLVARSERGLCSVHLGTNEAELQACLHSEYPLAEIVRNADHLCNWVLAILQHFEGALPHLDLPLDLQATAFQWRVWQEVCKIPYGETRTYRDIAQALGLPPEAAGAVARAVNENPVAVLIPCHRAERVDGDVTSHYSERAAAARRRLLAHEQQMIATQAAEEQP
jgi:AraC family transcriptional regulator of adaptative response/methylated-DNA-[protein]-cysteine methyltransferase